MDSIVIKIDKSGNVIFLYDDSMRNPMTQIGDMQMTRASNIRWNADTQMWDLFIVNRDGSETFHSDFENRGEAIDFELDELPRMLFN